MRFPLGDFDPGVNNEIGDPRISGSGQTGRVINMRDFVPGYTVKEGQFFSMLKNGSFFMYQADEDATADAAGNMTLTINPLLRYPPVDGTDCNFRNPRIEGLIVGDGQNWDLQLDYNVGISFSIKERR